MSVLAFDTCFGQVSVAVRRRDADGGYTTHALAETLAAGHAERLLPMIDGVMTQAGLRFSELAHIAVSIGPGTFTGVRTGIAAARALSLATAKPVLGTTSLDLMRHAARNHFAGARTPLAVTVDARRGEVYIQLFSADDVPQCPPQILSLAAALDLLAQTTACQIVGSGGPVLAEMAKVRGRAIAVALPALEPDARTLVGLADTLPLLDPVKPLYLRAPDAKAQTAKSLPRA